MPNQKVTIVGAGIVGVATAYFLACEGVEVEVIDRRGSAAMETSFGNGGVLHASETEPWSQPGMPMRVLKWLGKEDAPILVRYGALPRLWRWGPKFIANCRVEPFRRNARANLRLACHSLDMVQAIRKRHEGISYDCRTTGALRIFSDQKSLDGATRSTDYLSQYGLVYRSLSSSEVVALEPALSDTAEKLVGALYFPNDEIGDSHKFTLALVDICRSMGVSFRFDTEITGFEQRQGRVSALIAGDNRLAVDTLIIAAAAQTSILAGQLGLYVPIQPVKGVSITVDGEAWSNRVRTCIGDDAGLYGLVPLGNRLRISGSAEVSGYDTTPSKARCDAIVRRVIATFPGFAQCYDPATARYWAGIRPVTPTGTPILDRSPIPNLYLAAGHGHLGWTMGCGSGRVMADLVLGALPAIDLDGLRYSDH